MDVATFLARGLLLFLFLELLFLPFRKVLLPDLPQGFRAEWACTAFDEVFLYISFIVAFPSSKNKFPLLLLGPVFIELFNALRIYVVLATGDPFLHDLLFRWGTFLFLLLLFLISFRYLRQ